MKRHQVIILSGLTIGVSVIGMSVVYMPFYSNAAQTAKERTRTEAQNEGGGTRGSMWSNIEKRK
jgi:hypothetical protein